MIDSSFFINNRKNISKQLTGGLIILTAYSKMQSSNDSTFKFKQESNFWWLSGINEPDWLLIIDTKNDECWLASSNLSKTDLLFNGGVSFDNVISKSGVDSVLGHSEAWDLIEDLSKNNDTVYTVDVTQNLDLFNFVVNPAQQKLKDKLLQIFENVENCTLEIAKLRAIKQPVEIEEIKKAIDLTARAFQEVRKKLPGLNYEYEVEAEFSYYFRKNGAEGNAFDPIIAGGENACTLHYSSNNSMLNKNELLLIDIGVQIGGYSSDISRTFGQDIISERQIAVHDAVKHAQGQIINLLRPGLLISEYQQQVEVIMREALTKLGLLSSPEDYKKYFPHSISHGLGVDSHDSLGQPKEFLSGMLITVEPGIYIPEEKIGVRIEDNILITDTGYDNLSRHLSTDL